MYDHAWIALIIVAQKMSGHCSVVIVFDVIDMTLESISYSVLSLAYFLVKFYWLISLVSMDT